MTAYEGLAVKTLEEAETEIRSHKIVIIMGTKYENKHGSKLRKRFAGI